MTNDKLPRWRYYFLDLPLFSCGVRSLPLEKRLYRMYEPELGFMKNGFMTLCDYLKKVPSEREIDEFIRKTFWVKVVRESDAYTSLRMSKKKIDQYFRVEGIENLAAVVDGKRPVIVLTGHFGSFFIPAIVFSHLGFTVYPVARTVDDSPDTPPPTRLYLKLNYLLSERRFNSKYLYTNFSGRIDREIVTISKKGGIFWVAIDFPRRLFPNKRYPVTFFGRKATLPAGILPWALKKDAVFLTAWNSIGGIDEKQFYRHLTIDDPIPGTDTASILQEYADRLSERVAAQPWQWLALQVIHQFCEKENDNEY